MDKHVRIAVPCLLIAAFLATLSISSCSVPMLTRRPANPATATALAIALAPSSVLTGTPGIVVSPGTITNTIEITVTSPLASGTFTPTVTATATRVLAVITATMTLTGTPVSASPGMTTTVTVTTTVATTKPVAKATQTATNGKTPAATAGPAKITPLLLEPSPTATVARRTAIAPTTQSLVVELATATPLPLEPSPTITAAIPLAIATATEVVSIGPMPATPTAPAPTPISGRPSIQKASPTPIQAPEQGTPEATVALVPEGEGPSGTVEPPQTRVVEATYIITDVLLNGSFEGGFQPSGVATDWKSFANVNGVYGWADETWPGLVGKGRNAQKMTIKFTKDPEQYVGVYQTVPVVKGKPYELDIAGLIRSTEGNPQASSWGYRAEWGLDLSGGENWRLIDEWHDLGWDDQPMNASSYQISEQKATVIPTNDKLTLFIRGLRKWGTEGREVDFIIDSVALTGPGAAQRAVSFSLPGTGGSD